MNIYTLGCISATFLNAVGSGVGGFLGAILFFEWRLLKERKKKIPIVKNIYYPGEANKNGEGKLILGLGEIIQGAGELKHLEFVEKSVLNFNSNQLLSADKNKSAIFWGPYNADLNRKGRFRITFLIAARGFSRNQSYEINETCILKLDVLRTVSTGTYAAQDVYAMLYLKYRELAEAENGKEFHLDVYSSGTGIWEYRSLLAQSVLNNKIILPDFDIYFRKITITYLPEISLPW